MHLLLKSPEEILDWYFREFLPTLLRAASHADSARRKSLRISEAGLRALPEVTPDSDIGPVLALIEEVENVGPSPDRHLLTQIDALCWPFRKFIDDTANRYYATLMNRGMAPQSASTLNWLFTVAHQVHVAVMYQAAAPLASDLESDAAREVAISHTRNLLSNALSA